MVEPAPRNASVFRVEAQRQVGGKHDGSVSLRRIGGVGYKVGGGAIVGNPLRGAGRALGLHPVEGVEVLQITVRPRDRVARPGAFQATGDGIGPPTAAVTAVPAGALGFQGFAFGLGSDMSVSGGGAVCLAEGVAADDEGGGLLVIHRHAAEGDTNVVGRR